jgi:hypothetical protein
MKASLAALTLIVASLILLPTVLCVNTVSAQSSSYTVQSVNHTVEVMFSGHIVVRDVIKVSGSVAGGFQIGIPSKYGSSVLKAVAYDANRAYPVELNVQLGSQSGFYAVQVNFEGENPQTFTVEFLLSNRLVGEDMGFNQVDFPAYPGLTTAAGKCSATLSLPAEPYTLTISKSDGQVNATTYSKDNLPAYTNIAGVAAFAIETGLLQLSTMTTLERQISVNPSGVVTCQDIYHLQNNGAAVIKAFMLSLPSSATNIVAKGDSGRTLNSVNLGPAGTTILLNVTLASYLPPTQTTVLTAEYNLPNINEGSNTFTVFPAFNYYVQQAKFVFTPPDGAKISTSNTSASITTVNSQQTLTVNRQDASYVDFMVPGLRTIEINYEYNPLWSSYLPTFWAFGISAVACIGIFLFRKNQTAKKTKTKKAKASTANIAKKRVESAQDAPLTTREIVQEFVNEYMYRQEVSSQLDELSLKVQKGKLPRHEYKIQKRPLETRYELLTRSLNEAKESFKDSPAYADLVEQLESAEAEFNKADSNLKKLEIQNKTGEITKEKYKENVNEYNKRRDKAERVVNEILLRLREKTR